MTKTRQDRLKALEVRGRPADPVKVIWHCIGQPDPEELVQARKEGRVITWDMIEGVQNEQDTEDQDQEDPK